MGVNRAVRNDPFLPLIFERLFNRTLQPWRLIEDGGVYRFGLSGSRLPVRPLVDFHVDFRGGWFRP